MAVFRLGNEIPPKDRASARLLGRVHRTLAAAFVARKAETGLKQRDIAELTGIDKSAVSRVLSGAGNPTLRTLAEISWALDLQPDFILRPIAAPQGSNELRPSASGAAIATISHGSWTAGQDATNLETATGRS